MMPISRNVTVSLTLDEIVSLCSALNEVIECVEDWEFEVRLGRTKVEIENLLKKLQDVATRPNL
jgi:hypothetical protein